MIECVKAATHVPVKENMLLGNSGIDLRWYEKELEGNSNNETRFNY